MKGKLVSNATLQYYQHNYCMVCLTGIVGCRWHRYKQSTRDSRKRDLFWFTLFSLAFLYIVFYFYFWLIARNSFLDFNWYMFQEIKKWIPWYRIALGLTCATFAYFIIVMILLLCHVIHGHQLYIHPFHIVMIVLTLLGCIGTTVAIDMIWDSEWSTIFLSFKVMGPFLQLGAVILMTGMAWIISLQWFKLSHWGLKLFWICVFIAVMICLYIVPVFINSPCVTHAVNLPPKPKLLAHRGSSQIVPENTLMAFQYGLRQDTIGVESDVTFSSDCIPIILHDKTFERTTNIHEVFPDRVSDKAWTFNISEIKSLNAGSWFLQTDPFQTTGDLSDKERSIAASQKIPTLLQALELVQNYSNKNIMFDLKVPPKNHPCYASAKNATLEAISDSGILPSNIWWIANTMNYTSPPAGVTLVGSELSDNILDHNISVLNRQYVLLTDSLFEKYLSENLTVNIWTVNSEWLYSLCWCMGVSSATSDRTHALQNLESPVWHMVPSSYLILWVTIDVLSAVIIITIFIVQRIRLYGTSFAPEMISLQSARNSAQGAGLRSRTMKEKLLFDMNDSDLEEGRHGRQGNSNQSTNTVSSSSMNNDANATCFYNGNAQQPDRKYQVE